MAKSEYTNFAAVRTPRWAGEPLGVEQLVRGGGRVDAAQFFAEDSVPVTVGAAGAAGGATSVPVAALAGPIPSGTVLDFGGGKFAVLTAAAVASATTLAVRAIPTALVSGDTARYAGTKKKLIPSGTLLGRTYAERDAGQGFGPAASTDDEILLLALDNSDAARNPEVELYRNGRLVKENFLPGWATMAGALQTQVRNRYQTIKGVA